MKQTYFLTEVKSLPIAHPWMRTTGQNPPTAKAAGTIPSGAGNGGNFARAFQPTISAQLKTELQRVGAEVLQSWQVIGQGYDLVLIGTVPTPEVLSRIDAVCKANGYEARTHLAFEASEYAQEFQQTAVGRELATAGGRS